MKNAINCFTKVPDGELKRGVMPNDLPSFQYYVDGYIEAIPVTANIVMICNEEGKLKGMQPNFRWLGDTIVGPVIFCGVDGEEFADMPLEFEEFKELFDKIAKEVPHG